MVGTWLAIAVGGTAPSGVTDAGGRDGGTAAVSCPVTTTPAIRGQVRDGFLNEISGIVRSLRHAGVLWVHNDAGHPPELTAITVDGQVRARDRLSGVEGCDFEDIATDGTSLCVGDIGDGARDRADVVIYRVPEPRCFRKTVRSAPRPARWRGRSRILNKPNNLN